jgi:hypothetical protein
VHVKGDSEFARKEAVFLFVYHYQKPGAHWIIAILITQYLPAAGNPVFHIMSKEKPDSPIGIGIDPHGLDVHSRLPFAIYEYNHSLLAVHQFADARYNIREQIIHALGVPKLLTQAGQH